MAEIYLFDLYGTPVPSDPTPFDLTAFGTALRKIAKDICALNQQLPIVTDGGLHDATTAAKDQAVIAKIEQCLEKARPTFAQIEQQVDQIVDLEKAFCSYTGNDGQHDYFGVIVRGDQNPAPTSAMLLQALPEGDPDSEDSFFDCVGKFFLYEDSDAIELPEGAADKAFDLCNGFYDFVESLTDSWSTVKSIFYQQGCCDFDAGTPLKFVYPDCSPMYTLVNHNGPYTFGWKQHARPMKTVRQEVVRGALLTLSEELDEVRTLLKLLKSLAPERAQA